LTWCVHSCDMTRWYVWHDSFICVTWRNHPCDMTHSYVRHDSLITAECSDVKEWWVGGQRRWRIHMRDVMHWYEWHDFVMWCIDTSDMTHSRVWHDSCTRVTLLIYNGRIQWCTGVMRGGGGRCDSFIRVMWYVGMCDMTDAHVWHDAFIRMTWLVHPCDMTHPYVWHDSFMTAEYGDAWGGWGGEERGHAQTLDGLPQVSISISLFTGLFIVIGGSL